MLLTGSGDWVNGKAYLREFPAGDPIELPLPQDGVVGAVAFAPIKAKRICAVASGDNTIQLWRSLSAPSSGDSKQPRSAGPPEGESVTLAPPHQGRAVALAFSPDGNRLASGSLDKTARLWNGQTGDPLGQPLRHSSEVWSVAFTPTATMPVA
jgi:WD40 repeat protein